MTADDPVYWAVLRIEEGDHLFVDGIKMRTPEEVAAWEARAKRWTEKVMQGIKDRSPRDVATFRTLGRRPLVLMPVGHPYWTPPQGFIDYSTSNAECVESNLLSRLHDHIESLKVIADRWRANAPKPLITAAPRGRPGHDKPLEKRADDWNYEMLRQPDRTRRDVAEEIAAREGMSPETVYREASRARTGR